MSVKEIKLINKNIPIKKNPGLITFVGELYQIFQEKNNTFTQNFSKKLVENT